MSPFTRSRSTATRLEELTQWTRDQRPTVAEIIGRVPLTYADWATENVSMSRSTVVLQKVGSISLGAQPVIVASPSETDDARRKT